MGGTGASDSDPARVQKDQMILPVTFRYKGV